MTEREALNFMISFRDELDIHDKTKIATALDITFKALEKQIPKKPIYKEMPYSEEVGFNDEWYCPTCGAYVGYFTEGMNEPEQMEYCNECGQHIARDWSEDYE